MGMGERRLKRKKEYTKRGLESKGKEEKIKRKKKADLKQE